MTDNPQNIENGANPQAEWESKSNEALNKTFGVLFEEGSKLRSASSHYLDSYTGDNHPGVASSLEAQVKSAKNYEQAASQDELARHMVDTAATLTKKVENQLAIIRRLEDGTNYRDIEGTFENAQAQLKKLLSATDREKFDQASYELMEDVKKGINNLHEGATSGQSAANETAHLGEEEQHDFDSWWRSNYKDGYGQTMAAHGHSLQAFAETARDRNGIFQDSTRSITTFVREDVGNPVADFIKDFREHQFPSK